MYSVVGFKRVVSKKDGRLFFELHLTSEDRFVTGLRTDCVFTAADNINDIDKIVVGAVCMVVYDRNGRVVRVEF